MTPASWTVYIDHFIYTRKKLHRGLFYFSFCNFPPYREYIWVKIFPNTVLLKPHHTHRPTEQKILHLRIQHLGFPVPLHLRNTHPYIHLFPCIPSPREGMGLRLLLLVGGGTVDPGPTMPLRAREESSITALWIWDCL